MNASSIMERLAANAGIIEGLLAGIAPEQARWKPGPKKWSILEVACHLLDEEREDFRQRIDLLLHHPEASWPGIDPEGWVEARGYAAKDLKEVVGDLLEERRFSVTWLKGLNAPHWDRVFDHPKIGPISAGDLLASWAAHDFLHIRQLSMLHMEYVAFIAAPHSIRYAAP